MILKFIYLISHILCVNEFNIEGYTFSFVIDRTVKEILDENKTIPFGIQLKENDIENKKVANIIWDKYFPKPQFYLVDLKNFVFNGTSILECFSNEKKLLCGFKIVENNGLKIDNVYGSSKNILNVKTTNEKSKKIIFSNKEQNFESIQNSLEYMRIFEILQPLYFDLFRILYNFAQDIKLICSFVETYGIDKNNSSEARVVSNKMIEIMNTVGKSLALLSMPSQSKLKYAKPIEYYRDSFNETFKKLRKVISVFEDDLLIQKKEKNIDDNEFLNIMNIITDILQEILNENQLKLCEAIYENIRENLEPLEIIVQNSLKKNKFNKEIILDCDIVKVNKFITKYFNLLYEYCNFMKKYDDISLVDAILSLKTLDKNSAETALKDFYLDKLMCEELLTYLTLWMKDRTDLLILSKMEYFEKEISQRIHFNIEVLYSVQDLYIFSSTYTKKDDNVITEKMKIETLQLENLYNEWGKILNSRFFSRKLTFKDLIESNIEFLEQLQKYKTYPFYYQYHEKEKNSLPLSILVSSILIGLVCGIFSYFYYRKRDDNN